ncbi:MAG: signal peptidase II [Lentisphaeraceae bacterium]|nr:signal peptidase II [Lentisphaeraceae bacterium]
MSTKLSEIKKSFLWWPFFICLITIVLDQWSKEATLTASNNTPGGFYETVIEGFFYLTDHRNTGAAWGMFHDNPLPLSFVSLAAAIYFIWDFPALTENNSFRKFSWGLLIGGVLGNWIDRFFRREVIDMLGVYIPIPGSDTPYAFPIFNIADAAICVGVFLYFIHTLLFTSKKDDETSKDDKPTAQA